ncbi:MAG TPA: rhomboid family intramembrane serine protease [Pseudogracilibacillus sp.]|nr:rhomboid family intramembrane serine protease [Pseudogracilibacillus sp.]
MFVRQERSMKEFMQFYPVVSTIIIINLLLWLIINVLQLQIGEIIYSWSVGANYLVSYGEYWRLLTPVFLHGGFSHVLFNSFALVLFAPALEQMLGKFRFVTFYLLTGIIGNVGTYIMAPMSQTLHLGASGAIYGLFGIYIFMVLFRKQLIDAANAQIVTVIFVLGVLMSFMQPNINISAHLFGALGGFLLGPPFLIGVERFSLRKNYVKRTSATSDNEIRFDPDRWKKKTFRSKSQKSKKNIIWGIFIVLVLIGFIATYIVN